MVFLSRPGDPQLKVIVQQGLTVGDLEELMRQTDYSGFPVVVSKEVPNLVGFVSRRDLHLAICKVFPTPKTLTDGFFIEFSKCEKNSRRYRN